MNAQDTFEGNSALKPDRLQYKAELLNLLDEKAQELTQYESIMDVNDSTKRYKSVARIFDAVITDLEAKL